MVMFEFRTSEDMTAEILEGWLSVWLKPFISGTQEDHKVPEDDLRNDEGWKQTQGQLVQRGHQDSTP